MNNFGVIEVASGKTTKAPGWAYVPDVGPSPAQAVQPSNRKRAARNQSTLSYSDLSARQDAKIRKDLETLDRDTNKDVNIPIPLKMGGGRAQNKHTPNVRKILQSQKTFANHLDDYQALVVLAETNPAAAAALNPLAALSKPSAPPSTARSSPAPAPPSSSSKTAVTKTPSVASKRSAAAAKRAAAKEAKEAEEAAVAAAKTAAVAASSESTDTDMLHAPPEPVSTASGPQSELHQQQQQSYPPDGTILPAYRRLPPASHPRDDHPLLVSYIPPFPTDEELRSLITAPPLSYLEARAAWGDDEARYPTRVFCEVCGYWGRVRCIKCGARVCALSCLETHREECVTRYGL